VSRKKIFAEKRRREAKERREFHRDQFIRKLLKRKGIKICPMNPDLECFRGQNVYVDRVFKIQDCAVGVVLGCSSCKNASRGFEKASKGQTENLGFECRWSANTKFWIMQPHEVVTKPGVYLVKRTKPLYDAHGHVIEGVLGDDFELPRIRHRPSSTVTQNPGLQIGAVILEVLAVIPTPDELTSIRVPIPAGWLNSPQEHLADLLASTITRLPQGSIVNHLMTAYTNQTLKVRAIPGGFEFKIFDYSEEEP